MFSRILKLINTKDVSAQIERLVSERNWKELVEIIRAFPKEALSYNTSGGNILHELAKADVSIHARTAWNIMISLNADINAKNDLGHTPAYYALLNNDTSYLEVYADNLSTTYGKPELRDSSLLNTAIEYSRFSFAMSLLDNGYKADSATIRTMVFEGKYDLVRLAIQKDRSLLSVIDSQGNDLLYYAAKSQKDTREVIAFLMAQGLCDVDKNSYSKALGVAKDNHTPAYDYMLQLYQPKTPSQNNLKYGLHELDLVKAHYVNLQNESVFNPTLTSSEKLEFSTEASKVIQLAETAKYNIYSRTKEGKLLPELALMFDDANLLNISLYASTRTESIFKNYISAPVKDPLLGVQTPFFYNLISYDLYNIINGNKDNTFGLETLGNVARSAGFEFGIKELVELSDNLNFDLVSHVLDIVHKYSNIDWLSSSYANEVAIFKSYKYKELESDNAQLSFDM